MRDLKEVLTNQLGLDLTGWVLTEATDVSIDGSTIVGRGMNPSGGSESWVVGPPLVLPALRPMGVLALAVLLVSGGALMLRRRLHVPS